MSFIGVSGSNITGADTALGRFIQKQKGNDVGAVYPPGNEPGLQHSDSPAGSAAGSELGSIAESSQQGTDGPLPYIDTLDYLDDKFKLISVMIQQEEARYVLS